MTANPFIISVSYGPGAPSALWQITVDWYLDGGTTFQFTITDTTSGGTTVIGNQTGGHTILSQTLSTSDSYTICVACTDGGTIGPPSAAIPLITAMPTVTKVQNALTSIDLYWNAYSGYDYVATLQVGSVASSTPTSGLSMPFPVQSPLGGTNNVAMVQLALQVSGASTVGPPVQYTVITGTPVLDRVDYSQGENLTLSWNTLAGYSWFQAMLVPPTGDPVPKLVNAQTATFPGQLGAGTYTTYVSASSSDGVSLGPPSLSYEPITAVPTMTQVVNTGAGLQLAWQQLLSYTEYAATMQSGSSPATKPVPGLGYTFPGTPTGTVTCSVQAMSSDQVAIGPPSTTYTAITETPTWTLIAYDAGEIALTWQQVSDPSVTGYLIDIANLSAGGYAVGDVDNTQIPGVLAPLSINPATIRATNGIVWGPQSNALVPLTVPPLSPRLGYTGSALQMSWLPSGESDVTGYGAQLFSDGASAQQVAVAVSPQAFTPAFALGAVFTSRVCATGTKTQGPWSAVATGPYKTQLNYTFDSQARLNTVTWTGGATQTYDFDAAGNLLSAEIALSPPDAP
jgi:hypothetical protein